MAKRTSSRSSKGAGAFDEIRLLPGSALEEHRTELLRQLATSVVKDPPYNMRWLKEHPLSPAIIEFVTRREKSLEDINLNLIQRDVKLNLIQRDHVLALRGFLACGLLEHCLTRRGHVDYGIFRERVPPRRIAVPFRASDTPAPRAEYAQPDTLILYTLLSYFGDGLTREQVAEAQDTLLLLGPAAQKAAKQEYQKL